MLTDKEIAAITNKFDVNEQQLSDDSFAIK